MRLAVMMRDGLEIADRVHVVALGIATEGVKVPLGLWEASTENATLARSLLGDLVDRGLATGRRSCSSSTAAQRSDGRSATCSANARRCIAARAWPRR
jgi:transposase-like protein